MTFPISRTGNVALNSSERVSRTLHFSPGRDTRSFMTANNLVFLFACLLFTMSSANLLSPSQQRRPLGEEHRTVWGRRGVLEQPGHVDPQGRQESSVSRCWDPPPLLTGASFRMPWQLTHLSCKEKKADDHGLDPTSTLLSLQRIFFFFNALIYQNLSHSCPTLLLYSTLFFITPYSQLFKV